MSEAKIILAAVNQTQAGFAQAIAGLGSVHAAVESVKGTLEALGVTLSAGYFAELIRGTIDANEHLQNLHVSTDLSVQDLAGLRLLAKETGTDLDGLAKGVNRMSVEIGKSPEKFKALGITSTDAKGALKQFADIFNLLPDIQQRNALAQAVFQKSWVEMAPTLARGSQGIEEIMEKGARLSGVTAEMTAASAAFNDKIAELTGTGGFWNRQVATLLPLLNTVADDLIALRDNSADADGHGFKPLAETFRALLVVGGNVSFVFQGIGRDIGAIAAQAAALAHGNLAGAIDIGNAAKEDAKAARDAFDKWEAKIMTVGTALTVVGDTSDALSRRISVQARTEQAAAAARAKAFLDSQNAGKAAESAYAELNRRVSERLADQTLELAMGRQLTEQEKFETKALTDMLLAKKQLTPAERAAFEAKVALTGQNYRSIVAQREDTAENHKYADTLFDTSKALQQQLKDQKDATAEIGLNALAVAQLRAARLEDKAASLEQRAAVLDMIDWSGKLGDELRAQAKAYRELGIGQVTDASKAQLVVGKDMLDQIRFDTAALTMDTQAREMATVKRELERQGIVEGTEAWTKYGEAILAAAKQKADTSAAVEEAKKAAEEWKKTNDEINRTLTDALMNAFESGTGFGKAFVKTVEDMFKTMVLRPMISAAMSPISAGINAAINGGPSSAGSPLGSAATSVGANSLWGTVSSAYAQGAAGLTVGNTIGVAGVGANFGIVDTAAVGLGGAGGVGAGVTAALSAIPVAGWVAIGAMVLASAFGGSKGGPKVEGGTGWGIGKDAFGDTTTAKALTDSLQGGYLSAVHSLGATAAAVQFGTMFSKDPQGDSLTQLQITAGLNGRALYSRVADTGGLENVGRSDADLQTAENQAASRALLAALQATDMPGKLKDYLAKLDPLKLDSDQIQAAIAAAANAKSLWDAVGQLGTSFSSLTALSVEATAALADASGGFDALKANLSGYYDNFFSDEEKRQNTAAAISARLAQGGLSFSGSDIEAFSKTADAKTAFRQLAEAQDLTTESGRNAYAALMAVAGAFAALVPQITQAVDTTTAATAVATQYLKDLSGVFSAMGPTMNDLTAMTEEATAALADASGGFDQLKGNLAGYYDAYFSDEEKRMNTAHTISARLAEAGLTFSAADIEAFSHTADAKKLFRELAEKQDLTTESGRKAYAALMAVAGSFSDLVGTTNAATDSNSAYTAALRAQASQFDDTVRKFTGFADALKRFRGELTTGPLAQLSPEARYRATGAEFARLSALAPNNEERLAGLEDAGKAFLDASKDYNASSMQYFTDLAKVLGVVQASEGSARTTAQIAQMQLDVANAQLQALQNIVANTAGTSTGSTGGTAGGTTGGFGGDGTFTGGGQSSGAGGGGIVWSDFQDYFNIYGAGAGGPERMAWYLKYYHETQDSAAGNLHLDAGMVHKYFDDAGIQRFEVGTNLVPQKMLAILHPGEAVVPARYNPAAGGVGNTAALEAKIDRLIAVNQQLLAANQQQSQLIAEYARRDLDQGKQLVDNTAGATNASLLAAVAPTPS